jgi:hypothetical protein
MNSILFKLVYSVSKKFPIQQELLTKTEKKIYKAMNGTSFCTNANCPLVINKTSHKGCDTLSSLVIGLSGLSTVIFGAPMPIFSYKDTSKLNTGFHEIVSSFLNRNDGRPSADGRNTGKVNFDCIYLLKLIFLLIPF